MKTFEYGFLFALALFASAAPSFAQNPSMSWGEQLLSISGEECMRRTPLAFRAEGFYPESPDTNTTFATKGTHSAYLRCIAEPERGRTRIIIVVASNTNDGNVPGAERVRLQRRMEQPGAVSGGGCGLGARWEESEEGWAAIWTRRGNSNVFDVQSSKGGMVLTAIQTINIRGNQVSVSRTNSSDGNNCEMEGTIDPDGVTVTGTYRCLNGGPYNWRAVIKCQ